MQLLTGALTANWLANNALNWECVAAVWTGATSRMSGIGAFGAQHPTNTQTGERGNETHKQNGAVLGLTSHLGKLANWFGRRHCAGARHGQQDTNRTGTGSTLAALNELRTTHGDASGE